MKSKKTLILAASILTLTLSAFPRHATATSTTTPSSSGSQAIRKAGGSNLPYVRYLHVELAADILLSSLLP
jgi:hypothetical protein